MALLGLPLELLQRIIKETIPESIENVAVTCTTLHNASKIYLDEHNRLRKRYKHFSFSKYTLISQRGPRHTWKGHWDLVTQETGIELRGAAELIQEIVRNPVIPRYIQTADLKGSVGITDAPDDVIDEDPAHQPIFPRFKDEAVISELRNLLKDSPYLVEAGVNPEAWLSGMLDDTSGHAEVLLLTLLTNVRELALPQSWDQIPGRNSGHLRYGEETPRSDRKIIWPVLDALVRRANDPTIAEAGLSKLEIYRPFTGTGYECRNPMTVNTPFLALKSLREAYIGGCIALDDGYTGMPFDPEYPETLVDMKGLKKLKSLHIDGLTLMGPEFKKADEEYEIADAPDVYSLDEMAAPRALDLLPPSLEKFHFQTEPVGDSRRDSSNQLKKCLAALFDGFVEERGQKLPSLQEIVVEVVEDDMDSDLKGQLEERGARVVLSPAKTDPNFVTDFYRRFGVGIVH
ncbi:secreted protein [Colletotrichum kahawae]|uniref:Secreted protein n=1 Tax=Colletotrichum kahawae TaxID=34407 RepID=A0AAD9YBR0_COLKA|nr:secreted protein [Colletotrichum kahawae]